MFELCQQKNLNIPSFIHKTKFISPIQSDNQISWHFEHLLCQQSAASFLPFLRHQGLLQFEFEVLFAQLTELIQYRADIKQHEQTIVVCLMLCQQLQYQNEQFLNNAHQTNHFYQQSRPLKSMLQYLGYAFATDMAPASVSIDQHITKSIQAKTSQYNVLRQLIQRSKKFIDSLGLLIPKIYKELKIDKLEPRLSISLNYFVLLFFLPRTLSYLWRMTKHGIPGSWLRNRENELTSSQRLELQIRQHGFGFGDDLVWLLINLSICFFLTGPLAYWAAPMMMLQQFCEVISRAAGLMVEITPLIKLRQQYQQLLSDNQLDAQTEAALNHHLHHLDNQLQYHTKRLCLDTLNSTTVLVLSVLTLSLLSYSIFVPVVGATLALSATALFYVANRQLQKQAPYQPDKLGQKVHQLGLFAARDRSEDSLIRDNDEIATLYAEDTP